MSGSSSSYKSSGSSSSSSNVSKSIGSAATPNYGTDPVTGRRQYFGTAQQRDAWLNQRAVQFQADRRAKANAAARAK